jgi:hypothetical protein
MSAVISVVSGFSDFAGVGVDSFDGGVALLRRDFGVALNILIIHRFHHYMLLIGAVRALQA